MTVTGWILAILVSLSLWATGLLAAGLVAHVTWLLLLVGWDAAA